MAEREIMEYDVVIVGAGVAGLSAAIKLRQMGAATGKEISVCVLEKGSQVGAHILSGAVIEPRALHELFPDWLERSGGIATAVTQEAFRLLFAQQSVTLPTPPQMHNKGNFIISMGSLTQWLEQEAENAGVQIFAGFPAVDFFMEGDKIAGVITGDFGVDKHGAKTPSYQPGIAIAAKVTLLAEGCRGSLTERIIKQFDLRTQSDPQTYAIGLKEVWEIDPARHHTGRVLHTVGWPLTNDTYGGSFVYHLPENKLAIGFVVGLDYRNPYIDPFQEFQRFKTHPTIAALLKGGKRIAYGARALNEGGFQSIPALTFPGGALIGCAAGFMNVPKIKGSHTAIKSAVLAAEATFAHIMQGAPLEHYPQALRNSWVYKELYTARNIRPSFHKGLWAGLLYSALDTYILRGRAPWTLHHKPDYASLKPAKDCKPIAYPKPDGVLTFDRLSSVYLSNTNHAENQPVHLRLRDASVPINYNLPMYAEPAQRYCPAGVYEIIEQQGVPRLQINAQNCVHCKTCDIKDPTLNIVWVPPEGGGGPNYSMM